LHHREAPLFLNQGYPLTLDEEFQFVLPPRAQPGRLPGVQESNNAPLRWRMEWVKVGDEKLAARLHVELAVGDLSQEQTAELQKQLRRLYSDLAASATWLIQ
jgi:hypothetical protein